MENYEILRIVTPLVRTAHNNWFNYSEPKYSPLLIKITKISILFIVTFLFCFVHNVKTVYFLAMLSLCGPAQESGCQKRKEEEKEGAVVSDTVNISYQWFSHYSTAPKRQQCTNIGKDEA